MTDYSDPLTRLEKLPSLISDCFRQGKTKEAYDYLWEAHDLIIELQAIVRDIEAEYMTDPINNDALFHE